MFKNKIYDCITFFDENLLTNTRFEILKDVVDFFIVVESNYDHKGDKKKINFKLENSNFKNKVRHIVIENNFPDLSNGWAIEAYQREKILSIIDDALPEDYIMYSDSDEIPNPLKLKNLILKKKYGIFLQKCFNFKLNLFNPYETPWEGTRVARKKNLKSIDFMRQKIKSKNLNYSFFRFDKEKSIELFNEGGWHFNNVMTSEKISIKLKTFAHSEFSDPKFSDVKIIQDKINDKVDLFDRGHKYSKIEIDKSFPQFIVNNKSLFQKWIL